MNNLARFVCFGGLFAFAHSPYAAGQIGAPPPSSPLPRAQELPLTGRLPQGSVTSVEAPQTGTGAAVTVELVQPQESVATAEQDYINAVFAFNLAQVSLARAIGQTEQSVTQLLRGR